MPTTYPPGFASLSGDILTISRFLDSPTLVQRALRTLTEQQFVGEKLLTARVTPGGGAVLYEQNESIFADRTATTGLESIAPGDEFPVSTVGTGPGAIATVKKRGLDAYVTLEAIIRLRMNPVDRALTKLGNSVVNDVDSLALAAIVAAITQTQAATAAWGGASSNVLLDIATAEATIANLKQGYQPDSLLVSNTKAASLLADKNVAALLRRETTDNPIYQGLNWVGNLAGLTVWKTANHPAPSTALVLDSKVLGGMADERPFFTDTEYEKKRERWRLRAGRSTTPWVSEPGALVQITGI